MEHTFLLHVVLQNTSIIAVNFLCGLLVIHKNVKVNCTRKIGHFVLFFIPTLITRLFPYDESFSLFIVRCIIATLIPLIYIKPLRDRVRWIKVGFISFDRPEDRPYTLLWLVSQIAAGYAVLIPMIILFQSYGLGHLIMAPILIAGIGDGLAEPIGVLLGKHKYKVKALFSTETYYRSLEGSACVLITSLLVLGMYHTSFTSLQLVAAVAVLPVLMTLTEAFSPHTWDSPTLFLAGYFALFGIQVYL
jgi:dolichol kinase